MNFFSKSNQGLSVVNKLAEKKQPMKKTIALQSGLFGFIYSDDLIPTLKRQSLFFDHICVLGLSQSIWSGKEVLETEAKRNNLEYFEQAKNNIREIEWLTANNIIIAPETHPDLFYPRSTEDLYSEEMERFEKIAYMLGPYSVTPYYYHALQREHVRTLRKMSKTLKEDENFNIVTTLPESEYLIREPDLIYSDAIKITIKKLPIPDDLTPWEKIIEFRNDEEIQKSLLALRRWVRKISISELPKAEIEDEIEWLLNEFQQHIKIHKMKANTETLEALIKTPLEIIENLFKLNLSKIPDPLFAIKKRQLMLLEAEIKAPGKELSYIIKSREIFESND